MKSDEMAHLLPIRSHRLSPRAACGYERVFERQIRGLGRPGDVLIAISASGRSPNILRAIAAARQQGLSVVGLTGKAGAEVASICDLSFVHPRMRRSPFSRPTSPPRTSSVASSRNVHYR